MSHADPFRLRILKALTSAIESITPENDFTFDLRGKVFRGRDIFGETDPVTMISILEPPVPVDQITSPVTSTASSVEWDLLVQGFTKDDPEHPSDPAHHLMAAVKKVLAKEKKRVLPESAGAPDPFGMGRNVRDARALGNVVTGMSVGAGTVRPPDRGVSDGAYFWLTLTLKIVEDTDDPFL